jgi:hypothetical protein
MLGEELGIITGEEKKWFIRHIPIDGYIAHVCSEFPVTDLRMIPENEIVPIPA